MEDLLEKWSHFTLSEREITSFVLQRDQQLGEFIMAAQFHGVQPQSSASVREGEGGSVVVQPAEGMTEGGDDDVALKTIDGETLQTVEGNKEGEAQEINCVEVADTLQPIQGIQQLSDSLLPPINAPNNEGVTLESEFSVPNSVSEADLFDLQIRGNDEALNTYGENAEIKGIKFDVINSHSISPVNQTVSDERERASQAGSRATRGKQYDQLNAGNDDSSPIIAPINSNSQQSQRQVFNMVNIPNKEKSATTTTKGNEPDQSNQPPHRAIWKPPPWPILKVNSDDAIFREQNSVDVVLDMGGGLVLFWRSTIDVIVEGSGTNYIDTMFQEEDRAGIGVIIRECQGKGLAHMVGIIPLPLTVIELETLAISKDLQFDTDLSLEDVTPEGVSEIAMNALNADSQSLESFGLLSRDVKYFASLFHCIRFSHVRREGLLYSHIKRNDNGVAHSLAKNALCIPDFQVWMEDVPSHIGSILQLDVVEFY